MAVLINILLPVFIVAAISAIAYLKLKFEIKTFAKVAFYIFSPALVLDSLINSDVSGDEFGWIVLAYTITILLVWGLGEGYDPFISSSIDCSLGQCITWIRGIDAEGCRIGNSNTNCGDVISSGDGI